MTPHKTPFPACLAVRQLPERDHSGHAPQKNARIRIGTWTARPQGILVTDAARRLTETSA
jgi:hypothetical protein